MHAFLIQGPQNNLLFLPDHDSWKNTLEFVNKKENTYDYKKLYKTAKLAIKNLDQVIDINFYPTDKTKKSNSTYKILMLLKIVALM